MGWKRFFRNVCASRLQDNKLDIEHAGWELKLKTFRNSNEVLVEIPASQNPKTSPKRVFSKTIDRRALKFGIHALVAERNLPC